MRPRVTIEPNETFDPSRTFDVGRFALDLPIAYTGVLTAGSEETPAILPSALIRAYVYLGADGKVLRQPADGAVAVQVAETHSDAKGAFQLLIPPNLDRN